MKKNIKIFILLLIITVGCVSVKIMTTEEKSIDNDKIEILDLSK